MSASIEPLDAFSERLDDFIRRTQGRSFSTFQAEQQFSPLDGQKVRDALRARVANGSLERLMTCDYRSRLK